MNKQKEIDRWIKNHGAAKISLKERNIYLYDGVLFSIEKKKIRVRRICGYKKLPNGCSEVISTKKKTHSIEIYEAILWFQELDDTISYLQSMKRLLNKIGYKTSRK